MCLFVENLSVEYSGKYVLKNLTVKFYSGFNLIMGDSGSGKTTFLKALCYLLDFKGKVYFKDKELNKTWVRGNCKLIVQSGYYTENTIISTIKKPFELKYNKEKNFDGNMFKKLFGLFGLDKFSSDESINKLSGGELQRVALIRALLLKPKIFLADEPTSNLDDNVSKKVYGFFREYCKNRVCIIVSHDPIAREFSDSLFYFSKKGFVDYG